MKKHILVADDEETIRKVACLAFRDAGYKTTESESGYEALNLTYALLHSENAVDLVLSDIYMPGMNGLVLSERLKLFGLNVPTILMSGATDEESLRTIEQSACADYIAKPFKLRDLVDCVRGVLESASRIPRSNSPATRDNSVGLLEQSVTDYAVLGFQKAHT